MLFFSLLKMFSFILYIRLLVFVIRSFVLGVGVIV